MAKPTKRSLLFSSCSFLMAALFAYSASVQLNDPDWYFWFPLYASAAAVNLLQSSCNSKISHQIAKLAFWGAIFLFVKVVIETFVYRLAGILSVNLGERVVREKLGSGLVAVSMFLQQKASANHDNPLRSKIVDSGRAVEYGMALLVAVSFGLSLVFFVTGI